ncbi:hypothetical protein BANRA_03975 [Pseudomonas aeruginosa]|uniref:hypothetical protein n=1 Tax=Pseudomonas aeruginosa TaxID=287 RepID=UPI000F26F503|nr:hypothetical protein [Pseudomonas aeruginosa]MBM9931821.1 hypothetical protein [Pseudomonas aeruginosa]VCY58093.1 hypothetical protein BANRA_03975 [Pseudomonas aeruginosa]
MPDMREEFEDRFPIPEGIAWRNTDYFPVQTNNVHEYVALAGVAAQYTSMWEAWQASRAAKVIDEAWRSTKMAQLCPHCNEALLPEDVVKGVATASKQLIIARRNKQKRPK